MQLPINAAALALLCQLSAFAAVSPADIQTAIQKAQILTTGTSMNVRINNGNVVISTYRSSTNDNDCKIDAVFMARTAMDLAPTEINRVTIYFYSRADLTHYKEVTLTAGDLRAFGSGELKKEQLLSSVALIDHNAQDAVSLSNLIQASEAMHARNYDVSPPDPKGRVNLNTQLGSWVMDDDAKYEALTLAARLLSAAPAGTIKEVHVTFTDPDNAAFVREINLKPDAVRSVQQKINDDLAILAITVPKLSGMAVAAGPMKSERQAIAERIATVEKAGVGMALYHKLFDAMEQDAAAGDEAAVADKVKKLTDALDEQEKAKKEMHATTSAKPVIEVKPKSPPHAASVTQPKEDRWAAGRLITEDTILKDPAGTVARVQATFPSPDNNPYFYHFIRYVAQTLYAHGRQDEALPYDLRAHDLETRFPQLKTAIPRAQSAHR
jgi:hypothetical protein